MLHSLVLLLKNGELLMGGVLEWEEVRQLKQLIVLIWFNSTSTVFKGPYSYCVHGTVVLMKTRLFSMLPCNLARNAHQSSAILHPIQINLEQAEGNKQKSSKVWTYSKQIREYYWLSSIYKNYFNEDSSFPNMSNISEANNSMAVGNDTIKGDRVTEKFHRVS